MTALDLTIPGFVTQVLATYGRDFSFYVVTQAAYNPSTGGVTGGSTTIYTVKGLPPYPYERQYVNGSTVQEGDCRTLIAAPADWTPALGQLVAFANTTWRVISVLPISPGELVAAYEVQLRQ